MSPLFLALPLLLFATTASAQVYKCEGPSGVSYSDAPCKSGKQTVTEIPATLSGIKSVDHLESSSALKQQMDQAVKAAITANNLERARALAASHEHYEWIAAADNAAKPPIILGRTEADLSSEQNATPACQQATRSYELEASSSFVEIETLQAKRSIMHAACGIKEPAEVHHGITATTHYPVPRWQPYYRPGYRHRHWPQGGIKSRPRPQAEPPAVSVIVGPKK